MHQTIKRKTGILVPLQSLAGYVILSKSLNLQVNLFNSFKNNKGNSSRSVEFGGLGGLNEATEEKGFEYS